MLPGRARHPMNIKAIVGGIVALLVGAGGYATLGGSSFYEAFPIHFGGGIFAGSSKQFSIDSSGNATTTGVLAVNATTTQNSLACNVFSGSYADATTTLIALRNPFGATSTVRWHTQNVTGVSTSTYAMRVGTSTTQFPEFASQVSTAGLNVTVATSGMLYASVSSNGTPFAYPATSFTLGWNDWLLVHASSTNNGVTDNGGITGNSNTFAGTYLFEICR